MNDEIRAVTKTILVASSGLESRLVSTNPEKEGANVVDALFAIAHAIDGLAKTLVLLSRKDEP